MAESEMLLKQKVEVPLSTFTSINNTPLGKRPQAIAHRGYKAANPENTLGAFKGAVEVGAHAIETDLRLSKDGVVVLSHDPTLKRCFGEDREVVDCDWEYLKTLRTLKEPRQPMPRFKDLLEYLATPGLEDIWLLLDIKVLLPDLKDAVMGDKAKLAQLNKHADDLFRAIAATMADVKASRPWNQRVLVGCWAAKYLSLCTKHLPGYPITHIGFSIDYARQFLKVPGINFNMYQNLLVGPRGNALLRDLKKAKASRSTFLWTVNDESWMEWSIRKEVDGVITDDPKKYLEVCKSYNSEEKISHSWKSWRGVVWIHVMALIFTFSFRMKHGFRVDAKKVVKSS